MTQKPDETKKIGARTYTTRAAPCDPANQADFNRGLQLRR
jgi:hypothetical protein